ncbi:hypothetical protein GCM10010520_51120 [Rhizobium viscosum]|uniref:Cytochrome c2 n=1 Tax=Rhizobium viscosum TaxID=1673 RepID=A0ABR9J0H2_RHIVS|nr:hypothetical protein [Rhizobium viscosum]MBE1508567.1 cytochrome c2 [Rhizobium viscosum]
MAWTHIFETEIGRRRVEGFRYESHLKVVTVQKTDYLGDADSDNSYLTIPRPILAGEKIEIHGSNSAELRQELIVDAEFSEAEAAEIASLFD